MKESKRAIAEYFNWKCPYNGISCTVWNCETCEVEMNEINWMDEQDEEESKCTRKK